MRRGASDAASLSQLLVAAEFRFGQSGIMVCKMFDCDTSLSVHLIWKETNNDEDSLE